MNTKRKVVLGAIGLVSLGNLVVGIVMWMAVPVLLALVGMAYLGGLLAGRRFRRTAAPPEPEVKEEVVAPPPKPVVPEDTDGLVERMMLEGRYALLMRPQVAEGLSREQLLAASEALQETMGLTPEGAVVIGQVDEPPHDVDPFSMDDDLEPGQGQSGRVVQVEAFFLDRCPVTNGQFRDFVVAGGYEQISFWEASIWPEVLDFVDATGHSGPAFWRNGAVPPGLEEHPVVGVCWHEAVAYARWVGKRLPTDAEWVKAGSWPVNLGNGAASQRKYPWGDAMDRAQANLWGSEFEGTCPVDQYAEGVSVGGIYHLIGNVWEWTRGDFPTLQPETAHFTSDVPLKSIRGGAFDTYFDNQATCRFQSGEATMARKRNIGFRCALGVCDVRLILSNKPESAADSPTQDQDMDGALTEETRA